RPTRRTLPATRPPTYLSHGSSRGEGPRPSGEALTPRVRAASLLEDRRFPAWSTLARFLDDAELSAVPKAPKFPELGEHRFGNVVSEPVVQAQAEGGPASASQGDVVARQIDLLEAVVVLEVAPAVSLFFPEAEFRIDQVRDSPCSAGPDRLCDQHIRRSLVPVLDHRQDLHQARLPSRFVAFQLGETNQAVAEKRADEEAPVGESPLFLTHGLDVLPVVPELYSLADRRLVVDRVNPLNEGVIERHLPDHYPLLLGAADHVPGLVIDLPRPPVVIGGHG